MVADPKAPERIQTLPGTPVILQPLTRQERWQKWLALWKVAAALPTSERLMASVRRPHQQRGVTQDRPQLAPLELPLKRGKIAYPLWPGYTEARASPRWQKQRAIGEQRVGVQVRRSSPIAKERRIRVSVAAPSPSFWERMKLRIPKKKKSPAPNKTQSAVVID